MLHLAAAMMLTACTDTSKSSYDPMLVTTQAGSVRGVSDGSVIEFRAVPYAAPPTGDRRFAPPAPAVPWDGVRDGGRYAEPCSQGDQINEDCLYLNVTRPAVDGDRLRPVMVWLHGGGFSLGTPNGYDPSELAVQGDVVVVRPAFRLNVFGLFALPGLDGAGGFLLQDQQAALGWVRRNIVAFGGDPENVTLFGESGGAIAACAHLVSPASRGLFHRVILQSGSCSTAFASNFVARGMPAGSYFIPLADAEARGADLADAVGCRLATHDERLDCLRRTPAQQIAQAGGAFFSAAFGTSTLPDRPAGALAGGRAAKVPVVTGFNQEEGLSMVGGMQFAGRPVTAEEYPDLIHDAFGAHGPDVLTRYPLEKFQGRGDLAWSAVITDRMFACPQMRDARQLARSSPTFLYLFADAEGVGLIPTAPGLPRGASHTSELPLLFRLAEGPVDITTGARIERSAEQAQLSRRMIAYWTQFARSGTPAAGGSEEWPQFNAERPIARRLASFGPDLLGTAQQDHQCELWDRLSEGPP